MTDDDDDDLCQQAMSMKEQAEILLAEGEYEDAFHAADHAVGLLQHGLGTPLVVGPMVVVSDSVAIPDRQFWRQLALTLDTRGKCRRHLGQLDDSVADFEQAVELLQGKGREPPPDESLATVLHNFGNTLLQMAKAPALQRAVAVFGDAIAIREELIDMPGEESVADHLAGTLKARANAWMLLARLGEATDLAGAERDLERATELRRQLVEDDGQDHLAPALAMTRYTLGDLQGMTFRFGDAIQNMRRAAGAIRRLIDEGQTHRRWELALCLSGAALYGIGGKETGQRPDWPLAETKECAALYVTLLKEGRTDLLPAWTEFISQRALPCLFKSGDREGAADLLLASLRLLQAMARALPAAPKMAAAIWGRLPPPVLRELVRLRPQLAGFLPGSTSP